MTTSAPLPAATGPERPAERRCAAPGCSRPLPPPALDADGRPKGGRPAKYCDDRCRAAAFRARQSAQSTVVDGALARAGALLGPLTEAGQRWQDALADLTDQLAAAVGRAGRAETEAERLRAELAELRAAAERQRRDHDAHTDRLRAELDRVREQAAGQQADLAAERAAHAAARDRVKDLRADVEHARDQLAAAEALGRAAKSPHGPADLDSGGERA